MTRKALIAAVVLGALMLSAGVAFAQVVYGGYGAPGQETKPYVRVKVGWFLPNDSDLNGALAVGADYVVPAHQAYVTVDRLHADDSAADSTTWSLLAGLYRTVTYANQELYYAAGIGVARETLDTPLGSRDTSRFAWGVGGGLMIGRNGFGEIQYRDGGSDGNRGLVFSVGVTY